MDQAPGPQIRISLIFATRWTPRELQRSSGSLIGEKPSWPRAAARFDRIERIDRTEKPKCRNAEKPKCRNAEKVKYQNIGAEMPKCRKAE